MDPALKAFIDKTLANNKEVGLPSKEGEVSRYCMNNWIDNYNLEEDESIPPTFKFFTEGSLQWKGFCDGAFIIKGVVAVILGLMITAY